MFAHMANKQQAQLVVKKEGVLVLLRL